MSQSNTVTVKAQSPSSGKSLAPITVRNKSNKPVHLVSNDGKDSMTIMPNATVKIKGIFSDAVSKTRSLAKI
jgi:peroxiredoxin